MGLIDSRQLVVVSLLLTLAQAPSELRGTLVDVSGAAVSDATVVHIVAGNEQPVVLNDDGTFAVPTGGVLVVRASGFCRRHAGSADHRTRRCGSSCNLRPLPTRSS